MKKTVVKRVKNEYDTQLLIRRDKYYMALNTLQQQARKVYILMFTEQMYIKGSFMGEKEHAELLNAKSALEVYLATYEETLADYVNYFKTNQNKLGEEYIMPNVWTGREIVRREIESIYGGKF